MAKLKKIIVFSLLILCIFALTACADSKGTLAYIELDTETFRSSYDIDTFEISDINILLVYAVAAEGDTPFTETVPLTLNMVKAEDHVKFSVTGKHTINVTYKQKVCSFELTLTKGIADKFRVVFKAEDGTLLSEQYVASGDSASAPQVPSKDKHSFGGWVDSTGGAVSFDTVYSNMELFAKYVSDYCFVTFRKPNTDIISVVEVKKGGSAAALAPAFPVIVGETPTGWSRSLDNITEDTDIFAKYEKNTINVKFKYGFDSSIEKVYNYAAGERITAAPVSPAVEHAEFLGWYTNEFFLGKPVAFPYMLNNEMTFYAKYVSKTVGSAGLEYVQTGGSGFTITGYTGSDDVIVIPEKYGNSDVVGVEARAFTGVSNTRFYVTDTNQYFTIVDGVLFDYNKENLYAYPSGKPEDVYNVPSSVKTISPYAFYGAKNLADIRWGSSENLTFIGNNAFEGCTGLLQFNVPKSVIKIGSEAFKTSGISLLTTFKFGDGSVLEEIGNEAFSGLSALVTITLPEERLTTLGQNIFAGCTQLTEILIDIANNNFISIKGALYSKDGTVLRFYPANNKHVSAAPFVVEPGTERIASSAFKDSNIAGIVLPSSLNTVETNAFDSIKIKYVVFSTLVPPTLQASVFSKYYPIVFIPQNASGYDFNDPDLTVLNGTGAANYYYDAESGLIYSRSLANEITILGLKPDETSVNILNSMKNVTIPGTIGGYPVVSVGKYAFYNNRVLEKLIISEGVHTIDEYAFWYASALKEVTLPSSLVTISKAAFADCQNLTAIIHPAQSSMKINSIGDEAFFGTKWYGEATSEYLMLGNVLVRYNGYGLEAVLPSDVRVIAHSAFMDKSNLRKITLNSNLERIDSFAFYGCTGIYYIDIPASVKYIGNSAFLYCDNLFSVVMRAYTPPEMPVGTDIFPVGAKTTGTGSNANYSVGSNVFNFRIMTPNANARDAYKVAAAWSKYESSIIFIGEQQITFRSESSNYQFNLNTVYELFIPASIGNEIFAGWYSNEFFTGSPVIFPFVLTQGQGSVILYARWVSMEEASSGLEYILINDDREYAVNAYRGTDTYVIIPHTYKDKPVTKILAGAFSSSTAITNENVYYIELPSTVTEIEYGALNDTRWYKQFLGDFIYINDILLAYRGTANKVEVPSHIRYIMGGAFRNNSFIQSISFPDSISLLPADMLSGCINLTQVKLPLSLTSIRSKAFYGCLRLANLSFPQLLNDVAPDAFESTAWLNNYGEDCVMVNTILYKYKGKQASLHIPSAIKSSDGLSQTAITKIEKEAFKNNIYIQNVYVPAGVLAIGQSAFEGCINLKNVQFAAGAQLVMIADRAFFGCIMLINFSLDVQNVLNSIGAEAFAECSRLSSLEISAALATIGERAFADSGITYIHIASNSNIEVIPEGAFSNCINLKTFIMDINGKLVSIEQSAFSGCINLTSVVIPNSVKLAKIAADAFAQCTSLIYVELPVSLMEIGENAFAEVPYMERGSDAFVRVGSVLIKYTGNDSLVVISKEIAAISKDAFKGNASVKEIVFEAGSALFSIGEGAFMDCINLEKISFPLTVREIGRNAFENTKWIRGIASDFVIVNSVLVKYKGTGYQAIIPDNVYTIAEEAFKGNNVLQNITVGTSVTAINSGAFDGLNPAAIIVMRPSVPPALKGLHNIVNKIYVETSAAAVAYNENPVWNAYGVTVLKKYTITFDMGQNELQYKGAKLEYNGKTITTLDTDVLFDEPIPTLAGYSFAGWFLVFNDGYQRYEGDALSDKLVLPFALTKNVTLYAKWINNDTGSSSSSFILNSLAISDGVQEAGRYITHVKVVDQVVIIPSMYAGESIIGISKSGRVLLTPAQMASRLDNDIMTKLSALGVANPSSINKSLISVNVNASNYTLTSIMQALNAGTLVISSGTAKFDVVYDVHSFSVSISVTYEAFANKSGIFEISFVADSMLAYIMDGAFENCVDLRRIVLPASLKYIGKNAFKGCTNLKEIVFAGGTENLIIDENAFEGCTALEEIVFPANLTQIGGHAFENCPSLVKIEFVTANPPTLGELPFAETGLVIIVPFDSYDAYCIAFGAYQAIIERKQN